MKPVIGITCFVREATYGNWTRDAAILPSAYITMVSKAGGVPLIIPPAGDMTLLLDAMDGLIVAGGPDISPANYGEEPGPMTTEFYPDQDFFRNGPDQGGIEQGPATTRNLQRDADPQCLSWGENAPAS